MPELPEVECLCRSLKPHILDRRILAVDVFRADFVTGSAPTPASLLVGQRITDIQRRGKSFAIVAELGSCLAMHLGMTGQLLVRPADAKDGSADHVHLVWTIENRVRLAFRDPRRFGEVRPLASADALARHWAGLGDDALTISSTALAAMLKPGRRAIKAALLDQRVLAGVGNIYADEALFLAKISPTRQAGRLTPAEIARLAQAIRSTLGDAVRSGGSTLRDFLDADGQAGGYRSKHRVYGRGGQPCVVCQTPLRHNTVAQRTTTWCPRCQGGTLRSRRPSQ